MGLLLFLSKLPDIFNFSLVFIFAYYSFVEIVHDKEVLCASVKRAKESGGGGGRGCARL